MRIVTYPGAILRKRAIKIADICDAEREALSNMVKTMYLNQGVGLAAVQVGIDKQLAVVDIGNGLIKLINPVIISREGYEIREEGCLSVPNMSVRVRRAKKIVVNYLNEAGEALQLKAEGLLARAIQHEVDHLCGTLIIDHLNPIKQLLFKSRAKNRKAKP